MEKCQQTEELNWNDLLALLDGLPQSDEVARAYYAASRLIGPLAVVRCASPLLPRAVLPALFHTPEYNAALSWTRAHSTQLQQLALTLKQGRSRLIMNKGRHEYTVYQSALYGVPPGDTPYKARQLAPDENKNIMQGQLTHVLRLLDTHPRIDLRIVPDQAIETPLVDGGSIELFYISGLKDPRPYGFYASPMPKSALKIVPAGGIQQLEQAWSFTEEMAFSTEDSRAQIEAARQAM